MHFALRQRVEPDRLQAPGQGILHRGHRKHVGRSGQDEPAWQAPAVDVQFQRGEERRHPLHFVQDGPFREVRDKPHGVGFGGGANDTVVKAEVAIVEARGRLAAARQVGRRTGHLRQGGLPALARTLDQNSRRIFEGFDEPPLGKPGIKYLLNHGLIVTFGLANCKVIWWLIEMLGGG